MTNPLVLDALAAAFADSLEHLLKIETTVETIGVLENALHESDPEWRDNIDPSLRLLVEMAEDEFHDLRARTPRVQRATEQFAARSTVNGGIYDFFGFFDDAEAVQNAIDMTGRPQNFEVVRRLNTEWAKV